MQGKVQGAQEGEAMDSRPPLKPDLRAPRHPPTAPKCPSAAHLCYHWGAAEAASALRRGQEGTQARERKESRSGGVQVSLPSLRLGSAWALRPG